jgi:hypothetical protein
MSNVESSCIEVSPPAAVPTNLDYNGTCYSNAEQHEQTFVHGFDLVKMYSDGFCEGITDMLKHFHFESGRYVMCCTAFHLSCEVTGRALVVSDLVYCPRAVQNSLFDELFYTLLTICASWQDGIGIELIVINPIALVRETLTCACDAWDEAACDLRLSVESVRSALLSIPTLIINTGCTTTPSELRIIMENYNIAKQEYDTELSDYQNKWDEFQKHADIVVMGVTEFKKQQKVISASEPSFPEPWMVGLPILNHESISKSNMVKYEAGLLSIDSDYVRSLECLLYRLHLFASCKTDRYVALQSDAVRLKVIIEESQLQLEFITTRSCLIGHDFQIGTMVIWRLMACCIEFNISTFSVLGVYPSTAGLLRKLGGFERIGLDNKDSDHLEQNADYTISMERMKIKTLAVCGLTNRVKACPEYAGYYTIRSLPPASWLNNQSVVCKSLQDEMDARERFRIQCLRRKANAARAVRRQNNTLSVGESME